MIPILFRRRERWCISAADGVAGEAAFVVMVGGAASAVKRRGSAALQMDLSGASLGIFSRRAEPTLRVVSSKRVAVLF
jgi:hypothetical protein